MADRTCSICGTTYPLDKQHFRWRVQAGKGYFTAECLSCRAKEKKKHRARKKQQREDGLSKIEESGVDVFLASLQKGGSNIPHSAEVIERVFEYFGGVGGFAGVLVKQYWDSPPGSSARNRLLETLCRLVSKNVEQGGAKKPLTLWTEEELEQEMNSRFAQAVAALRGTINVEAEKVEALPAPEQFSALSTLAAQAAEEASRLESSGNSSGCDPVPVPARQPAGDTERTEGAANGSLEALPAEPEPGRDSRLSGE